ncbi:MAG: DUF2339 domain-containing protein [Bacteroidia bacterium]|jgi:uncharacterized membrane protein|nr:DUF2339 domain-containing protein [Bacteroidia bacterium]
MSNYTERILSLEAKLNNLYHQQKQFQAQIKLLEIELASLKNETLNQQDKSVTLQTNTSIPVEPVTQPVSKPEPIAIKTVEQPLKQPIKSPLSEAFIGGNLMSKIGIVITVIGVAIGANYAIDHNLITPITRIILGYAFGVTLLLIGIKLKKYYHTYSAVLVSGALAILYFLTYQAYDNLKLLPQVFAFVMMLALTVFAVISAISYNRQIIAHFGLVGGYAIPLLLSTGSGQAIILFIYITIINIGILAIAIKKYWKNLYYSSFLITWLIFIIWIIDNNNYNNHPALANIFATLFFVIFYIQSIAYKLLQKEMFKKADILSVITNAFTYYAIGYFILKNETWSNYNLTGAFTLFNAIVHLCLGLILRRLQVADKNLMHLVSGLALTFVTITIPVQFDANWVTLLWIGEAAILFWIGRTKQTAFYEWIAYVIMLLAFISQALDWLSVYDNYVVGQPETKITPIFNIYFLSALLVGVGFGWINYMNNKLPNSAYISFNKDLQTIIDYGIPALFVLSIYFPVLLEISNYWNQLAKESTLLIINKEIGEESYIQNLDLKQFKQAWNLIYTMIFSTTLGLINLRFVKNKQLGKVYVYLSSFIIIIFLLTGLYALSELRVSYLNPVYENYPTSWFHIFIRYISLLSLVGLVFTLYKHIHTYFKEESYLTYFDIFVYTTILWVSTSELIHWMDMLASTQKYKLAVTILFAVYALILISIGLWQRKAALRIYGIALFAATLIKLFLYDLSGTESIEKTITFIIVGILLLVISFLYNKYKSIFTDKTDTE